MTLLKVGSRVINTEYIAHVDLEKSGDVIVYLKTLEDEPRTGGLKANQNSPGLELEELKFSGEEAEALKRYFHHLRQ